jgi:hypothetical protein
MSFREFDHFDTGLPDDDDIRQRLEVQQDLLAQSMLPLYEGLDQSIDYQQDQLDGVNRRLREVVKRENGKADKLLVRVQQPLADAVQSRTGEQQSMIDVSAARLAANRALGAANPSMYAGGMQLPPPSGPVTSSPTMPQADDSGGATYYYAYVRCTDGSRRFAAVADNVLRSSLASQGYLQYPDRQFTDPFTPIAFWDSQVGMEWIKLHCNPQGQGPPPPDPTIPDPTGPPDPNAWYIYYHCGQPPTWYAKQGYFPPVANDPITYDIPLSSPSFASYIDAQNWGRSQPDDWLPQLCVAPDVTPPPIGTPPPPGCCPPWDLQKYIDALCKCIKQSGRGDRVDVDQPIVYFVGEGKEKWHSQVSEFLGFDGADAWEAKSLAEIREVWNRVVNG